MKKLTTDQWMGIGLGVMAAGVLALAILDVGGSGGLMPAGTPMPAFHGALADGGEARFEDGDTGGTVLLIDFWATWCPACVRSMPTLQKIRDEFEGRGFALMTVNLDEARNRDEQAALVRGFMQRRQLDLPVLLDDGRVQRTYGAYTLPTLYLVNRDGTIRRGWAGAPSERVLRREIQAALAPGAGE